MAVQKGMSCCIFHEDKTPSMKLYHDQPKYLSNETVIEYQVLFLKVNELIEKAQIDEIVHIFMKFSKKEQNECLQKLSDRIFIDVI